METEHTEQFTSTSPVLSLTVGEFKGLVAQAARGDEEPVAEMAGKWDGGDLILRPGKPGLQEKTIPIDAFFHKIVMLRDRLRVMEQKINGNKKLSDGDKVELQQYLTRIYGSLTTFNVLFRYREDHIRGEARG